ncbi:circadian clock-controlled protein daywake [Bombus vancouverensis nearcticus]|uniref:Circadian clock-controlled protein-like n=1 Tax=Bombus bifarius TaxID=103933 RepID=A0A6P8LUD6_9HYME|nr:circadian clock-controlled protein-like [Bombus vancouverensis nearcticus]XP_033304621.1 circadian clock-controlled protein-like [Bombus bifarius]
MKTIVLAGLIVAIFGVTFAHELPDFIHVCKKNDPNLADCIKASVNSLKPKLKTGVPEYKIPSLEPLELDELVGTSGGNIKLMLKNVTVHGASNFTLLKMKANLDTLNFVVELDLPNLSIEGNYDVDGRVILLQIRGSGPMTGDFTNCKALVKLQMQVSKRSDGENYLKLTELKTRISVGGGKLNLRNLFGGDPVLGEAVNTAINSNFDSFMKEIKPSIESAISNTFTGITNGILEEFTYEMLFPES